MANRSLDLAVPGDGNSTTIAQAGLLRAGNGHQKNGEAAHSLSYYEQLMRHDWHGKVRHRVRQRGWGK